MSDVDTLLKSVREIEPIIRQHAAAAERDRKVATPVATAMKEAGLYRMWQPKAYGGFEMDPVAGFRVLEEVARIDSAAGWNLQVCNAFDTFGAWFDDNTAKKLWGGDAIIAGAFNPARKAVPVEGGYRVSGRTPFASGAHQASVFLGLANIFDNGEMRMLPEGIPVMLMTACTTDEARIVDNWNTLGMRGTGSHDVNVEDVFLPNNRAVPFHPLEKPGGAYEGPLYRLSTWPATAAIAPAALGIARAAIEETVEVATQKAPAYTMKTLKDRAVVQSQLARAEAKIASSRAYLYDAFDEAWEGAVAGKPMPMSLKAKLQLSSTNAVLESAGAVDLTHSIVGASGIREEQAFSRHFRDIHVITQHGFINESKLESVGQIMLGLEPEWPFFAF